MGSKTLITHERICKEALRLLNNDLKGKISPDGLVENNDEAKQIHITFRYDEEDIKKSLDEFTDDILRDVVSLLSDKLIHDAKKGEIAFGKIEIPPMAQKAYGCELNGVKIRLISDYDILKSKMIARIDVLYKV